MKFGFTIGGLILYILKKIFGFIKMAFNFFCAFLAYTGLYIPFFYLIYSIFIFLAGLKLSPFSLDAFLFYTGLILSFICSIIICVKNYILKPTARFKENIRRKKFETLGEKFYKEKQRSKDYIRPELETPLIYRSIRRPDWIIYEYSDKFNVYAEEGRKLKLIKVVPKEKRNRLKG